MNDPEHKGVDILKGSNSAKSEKTSAIYYNPVKQNKLWMDIKRDKYLYLLLVPCVVYYLLFVYKPMLGLQIAFLDYNPYKGIKESAFIGLEHFKFFFQGPYFWRTLRNTLLINMYSLVFEFPSPIILALLLNELKSKMYKRMIQTISYIPHFVSIVVVVGIVTNFLAPTNGIVNIIINKLGGDKTYFLTRPEYFRAIYTTMNIWKHVGFNSILYIAALTNIDTQLYEACVIDGGNRWNKLVSVTLPGILPTIIIMLILRLGDMLAVGYESIILLYQPATYETADVISTYVFRLGIQEAQYGFATAVGLFNSVVGLILVILANALSKKVTETSLW